MQYSPRSFFLRLLLAVAVTCPALVLRPGGWAPLAEVALGARLVESIIALTGNGAS